MRVYIEITGYIKNHQNFKILFWSRESEKTIFTIFPYFVYENPIIQLGVLTASSKMYTAITNEKVPYK